MFYFTVSKSRYHMVVLELLRNTTSDVRNHLAYESSCNRTFGWWSPSRI